MNALAAALAEFGAHMRATNSVVVGLRDEDTVDICTEISRSVDSCRVTSSIRSSFAGSCAC